MQSRDWNDKMHSIGFICLILILQGFLFKACELTASGPWSVDELFPQPSHSLLNELLLELSKSYHNISQCKRQSLNVTNLMVKVANDYSILHLHGEIEHVLQDALRNLNSGCISFSRVAYTLSVLYFSRGLVLKVSNDLLMFNCH